MMNESMTKEDASIFDRLYDSLNERLFAGCLPDIPVHVVCGREYSACCGEKDGRPVYINLSIDNLKSNHIVEELTAAMLHEMIHAYCILNDIPHYDKKTGEHLPGFIKAAEEHGLFYDDFMNTNFLMFDL